MQNELRIEDNPTNNNNGEVKNTNYYSQQKNIIPSEGKDNDN